MTHNTTRAHVLDRENETTALVPRSEEHITSPRFVEDFNQAEEYAGRSRSEATRRAYKSDWNDFAGYCSRHGVECLPADPRTVAAYLAHAANSFKVSTLQRRLSAISVFHKNNGYTSPTGNPGVLNVWEGIRREKGTRAKAKRPALADDLRMMLAALPSSAVGIRNRALLLLGFFGAFRRSELVSLNVEDVAYTERGIVLTLRRSKTDQAGEGREIAIPAVHGETCPVAALTAWLEFANIASGPIFRGIQKGGKVTANRLSDKAVVRAIKAVAESVGLNAADFAGHSLRAGFATQAALSGATDRAIMNQTGHRSRTMVDRYVRIADLWEENAATKVRV